MTEAERVREIDRARYARNPSKKLASNRAYYERTREARLQAQKEYHKKNREKRLAYHREYAKRNRAKWNAYQAAWRAQKLKATPAWVDRSEIEKIYSKASDLGLHVDHIVPLQNPLVPGLHVPWNLQLLTPEKNKSKGNRI